MLIKSSLFPVVFKRNHRTIITQKANVKVLALLVWLLVVDPHALAQIESGTVIVIGYSKNKIIMAADSRVNYEAGRYYDVSCKITALSNKFLFSAAGRTFGMTGGNIGWDDRQQAREAFAIDSQQPIPPSLETNFADDLTDLWAEMISNRISVHIRPEELWRQKPGQPFLEAAFAGIGPRGDVQIGHATIRRASGTTVPFWQGVQKDSNPPNFVFVEDPAPILNNKIGYLVLGGDTPHILATEFFDVFTTRSKAEHMAIAKLSKASPPQDADALMVIGLVQFIIKYTDRPEEIGGPIDAAEIDKGGTIRWIQRKDSCK